MGASMEGRLSSEKKLSMSRRRFLSQAASVATMTAVGAPPLPASPQARQRIAVIGGGMSGIASAWFCDKEFEVDLFEARSKIGGHCDSRVVDVQDRQIAVDLGAQFFHPGTHPLYTALLEYLGMYRPGNELDSLVVETKGSLNIFDGQNSASIFSSNSALATPLRALDFALYTRAARAMVLSDDAFDMTMRDWVDQLYVSDAFKDTILIPLLSSFAGTSIENTLSMSARSVLSLVALAFPANLLRSATTFNSNVGLGGILDRLAAYCQNLTVRTNAPVSKFYKHDDGWFVEVGSDRYGPYQHIILSAPAEASQHMFDEIPWAREIESLLGSFQYFDARIVIHSDPIYMSQDHRDWGVYNVMRSQDFAEGSAWYGAFRRDPWGRPLSLFKSWALTRHKESRNIYEERQFRHPLVTPEVITASRQLMKWQGHEGLWFAGQYTTGIDLQETAFYSARRVAESLNPNGVAVEAFRQYTSDRGLANIRYDL